MTEGSRRRTHQVGTQVAIRIRQPREVRSSTHPFNAKRLTPNGGRIRTLSDLNIRTFSGPGGKGSALSGDFETVTP